MSVTLATALSRVRTSLSEIAETLQLPAVKSAFTMEELAQEGFFVPVDANFNLEWGPAARMADAPTGATADLFCALNVGRHHMTGLIEDYPLEIAGWVDAIADKIGADNAAGTFAPYKVIITGGGWGFTETYDLIAVEFTVQVTHWN